MSRFFEIFGGVALAGILAVKEDRNTDFQNTAVNASIIKVGGFLQNRQWDIGCDNHRLTGEPIALRCHWIVDGSEVAHIQGEKYYFEFFSAHLDFIRVYEYNI